MRSFQALFAALVAATAAGCANSAARHSLIAARSACAQGVLNDWFNEPIEYSFSLACYRDALRFVRGYGSGEMSMLTHDLERQLARARNGTVPPER